MPHDRLTRQQAEEKYKDLILAWKRGENPRPSRSGRLPKEVEKIRDAIFKERVAVAKRNNWFAKKSEGEI
ncbi:hypothetical protein Pmar_PMAR021396 [Perkinsus marinus ATCC 50983]|uniref:Uncharacterized protein n=1 Tax=Perkinsus marinus (strain ATCC 50983 / TXsc) TaxID=423536 RepID=C5KX61_PERM5|nr:hypothetical protein Pmar_PMAR014442 [Perkinsus marinus ATCC 50983]XP_002779122.1 hypothetical protein Pmar_PMAR021396 [Perkinsus marinus ATCC 50983]EER10667.1 hypothetical protein Pmar_PMAR014442 [Perkinsus marinus ATCC 50983]EER10917.1 hypothetical protein Pmar_PMAR021396 [Perkinsus marinus ATCC 50983]|eukprot:XP_002778872.1 hypothetical protein Pmar_PMAR014442 [Perkinsus marinus ATCC 50983]